jgi:general secretion pathway protein K
MNGQRQRGLALASVLWGVLILSLIAASMLTQSVTGARIQHNVWNATKAGSVADEAVARAILELLDDRPERRPRVDGTRATLRIDGAPVTLWIQDESGKLNLNLADKTLLQGLFVSAGMARSDAEALADRIVARRTIDAAHTAAPFRSTEELLTMPGVSRELFERIAPALTVYGKSSSPNQDVAPREVLRALPGLDARAIDDLLRERDKKAAEGPPQNALPLPLAANNAAFLVTAEVDLHGARVVRVAAVQFTGDATNPYLVLAWR